MKGRIQETDLSVPYKYGDYFYYSRTEEGRQYPLRCRKRGSLDAPEEITLDQNALAEGHSYLGLGAYEVSDDGNLLAFSTDVTGFRQYTLQVKDLRTGEMLPDRVERTISVEWAADGKTLFYTVEDDAKRPYRLYRHTLGVMEDTLVYEEADALFNLGADRSRSKAFLFVTSESSDHDRSTLPARAALPKAISRCTVRAKTSIGIMPTITVISSLCGPTRTRRTFGSSPRLSMPRTSGPSLSRTIPQITREDMDFFVGPRGHLGAAGRIGAAPGCRYGASRVPTI